MVKSKFLIKSGRANSIRELIRIFDSFLSKNGNSFGVKKKFRVSIDKTRIIANAAAMQVLNEIEDPLLVTEEQKEILRAYTGEGNIGGSTDEYYTPAWLASGVWDALSAYGSDLGNVCEPSAGTGVFNGTKPQNVIITATELSETSSRINQILHPEDDVKNINFEQLAADPSTDNSFDAMIGNVPFGDHRGMYKNDDPDYADIKTKEAYFILRTIDKVKPGGYLTLILPQNIISTNSLKKIRQQISRKAEFLGAHKIPSGSFANQGSDSVVTDVIVLRKHSEEMADLIVNATDKTLREANVLWPTFINGQWFKEEGKKFIHGEVREGAANYGGDLYVIPNLPKGEGRKQLNKEQLLAKDEMIVSHNQSTAKAMSTKFESRIDWELLELSEPEPNTFINGDSRIINGRWHEYEDGEWLPMSVSGTNGLLDEAKYGAKSIKDIEDTLSTPQGALSLNFKQLQNINANFKDKTDGIINNAFKFAGNQKDGLQERVVRGALIGEMIENYKERIKFDPSGADTLLQQIRKELNSIYDKFGTSHHIKIKVNTDSNGIYSLYQSFVNAMDEDGSFSDLIKGELNQEGKSDYDTSNPQRVVEMLISDKYAATYQQSLSIDERGRESGDGKFKGDALRKISANMSHTAMLDDFRNEFTGSLPSHVDINDDNSLLDYLSEQDNVAIDENGQLTAFDRATSGSVSQRKAQLKRALTIDGMTEKQKANISRQLDAIEEKRKAISKNDITFKMRDKWIPTEYILEFLHDSGYDEIDCKNGFFFGYSNDANREDIKTDSENALIRQVENYINGNTVHAGGPKGATAKRRDEIRRMEIQFHRWMLKHDDIDKLVELNQDAFHDYIPFEHSDKPLELTGVSGNVENMPYQNSGIRRLSEEGKGILAFGTGLGKTFTALGLARYNKQEGRSNRTCIVIPKAVNENWINETCDFYGYSNLNKILFVGHEFERNEETGDIITRPVLDEFGVQKVYPANKKPRTTPALKELNGDEIAARMNKIPHSNYELVIMTKEQFAAIPIKKDTLETNVNDNKSALAQNGHIDLSADTYKAQNAVESAESSLSDIGTDKNPAYPFFEDMQFDDVIVDEAHNYRNASKPGKEARNLRYLATGTESKVAVDMRQKMQFLTRNNNGRGPILLTATPTPNSPLDIYNMMSHLLGPDEMMKYGIANQDDFVSMFGETSEVMVSRIDGSVVSAQGLTGFNNLPALRAMMAKYINRKNIKDVAADTKVPEIVNESSEFDMTQDQKDAYEFLRLRAEVLSATKSEGALEILMGNSSPEVLAIIEDILINYPDDQIFSIIRDMDRTAYDVELFNAEMTFIFSQDKTKSAIKALDSLPKSKRVKIETLDDSGNKVEKIQIIDLDIKKQNDSEGKLIVTIPESFEDLFIEELYKQKVLQSDISHPISPKYAQLIENLKESLANGGKQIIFTEEKSQHRKLHRILSHHLDLKPNEIGILNGDTVSGIESANNADQYRKLSTKKKKELQDQGIDIDADGLEAIASKYNSGQFKILICNKKAEVGVNLHIGTTDIHHLTIPWTPASIDQRNGRGARVGAPQEFVKSHNYLAKGSFDQFRLDTVNRKRKWQEELITGNQLRADNGDADNENEQQLLLAKNPEEMAAMLAAQKSEAENRKLNVEQNAAQDLAKQFIVATALSKQSMKDLDKEESDSSGRIEYLESKVEQLDRYLKIYEQSIKDRYANGQSASDDLHNQKNTQKSLSKVQAELKKANHRLKKAQRAIIKHEKAKKRVIQLRPQMEDVLKDKRLNISDEMLSNPENYLVTPNGLIGVGETYFYKRTQDGEKDYESVVRIESVNNVNLTVQMVGVDEDIKRSNEDVSYKVLTDKVEMSKDDVTLILELKRSYSVVEQMKLLGDEATLYRLWDSNLLPNIDVLTFNGKGYFVSESKHSSRSEVVWPDSNERLQENIARWYIQANKEDDFGRWGMKDKMNKILTIIFNTDDPLSKVALYDENALSTDDILSKVNDVNIRALFTDEIERLMSDSTTEDKPTIPSYAFKNEFNTLLLEQFDKTSLQIEEINKAIDARLTLEVDSISEEYQSKINAIKDQTSQIAQKALSSSDEEVKERLKPIAENYLDELVQLRYRAYAINGFINTIRNTEYDGQLAWLIVDLIKAGYSEPEQLNGFSLSPYEITKTLQNMAKSISDEGKDKLHTFVGDEKSISSYVEDDEPSVPETTNTDDISFAKALFDKYGIQCKKNTQSLTFKSRTGKTFAEGEPYEFVGFFDSKGKSGELIKVMSPLKRQKPAKAMYPSKGIGFDEFDGFWWFVRVSDLDLIESKFDM